MESVLLVLFFPLTFEQGQKEEVGKKKKKLFYSCSVQFYSVVIVVDCSVNPVKSKKSKHISTASDCGTNHTIVQFLFMQKSI